MPRPAEGIGTLAGATAHGYRRDAVRHRQPKSAGPTGDTPHSTGAPCPPSSLAPRDINIVLLTAQIKHCLRPPSQDYAFKLKVTFCVRGVTSPWLSNLVLDQLDKALEGKGLRHVRYADDFVVLTKTRQEAADALAFVAEVLGKLKLSLHETKTRLTDFNEGFEFLGFCFRRSHLGVRAKSLERFKDRIRSLTRRQQGRNVVAVIADVNAVLRGWSGYFGVAEVADIYTKLDCWIRMRIRSFRLQRRCLNDNWRLRNQRLAKWGLLSLLQCRPSSRLLLVDTQTRESGSRLLAMRNPRGVAQCSNAAC